MCIGKGCNINIRKCQSKKDFHENSYKYITDCTVSIRRTAVAQWLRCCATNRKVAGSIPVGVIGIFH